MLNNKKCLSWSESQRPLPLKLVTVGKDRGSAMESVAVDYVKKIQRYCAFEEIQLRPNPKNSRYAYHIALLFQSSQGTFFNWLYQVQSWMHSQRVPQLKIINTCEPMAWQWCQYSAVKRGRTCNALHIYQGLGTPILPWYSISQAEVRIS